jgi:outer membrane protein TolC
LHPGVRLPFLLPLLLLWTAVPARAQSAGETRALALRDAIALAVRGNPVLAAAGADVRIGHASVMEARGQDDFLVEASAEYQAVRRELVTGRPLQTPAEDLLSGALTLWKPIATGGRLGLSLVNDFARSRFATDLSAEMQLKMDGAPERSAVDEYAPSVRLAFQHPLLRGFGPSVARAPQRRAAVQVDLATAQQEGTAAALVRDVETAYWDLAYATQQLAIRRAAAASAREQLRRVQANIEVGKQPRSASAEVDVAVALRDEGVLLAEQSLSEQALELGQLLGMRLDARKARQLVASDEPVPPGRTIQEPAALAAAMARNPQLLAVRAQGRSATIEVDVTRSGLLPQLDFALSGGPSGNANDAPGAYRKLQGLENYVVSARLIFSHPIGRHAARGAHEAAREDVQKARLRESEITDQVTVAVVRGVLAVDTAHRRGEVLARTTEAAQLDLDAEKARFEVGRSTNFDVLRRQDALAGAQLTQMRARVDQLRALAFLDALTGEILRRHGVELRRGP